MNHVRNPEFAGSLSYWNAVGGADFSYAEGVDQLGSAQLPVDSSIEQSIWVERALTYTLSLSAKGNGATVNVLLRDAEKREVSNTNIVITDDAWNLYSVDLGLPSASFELVISTTGATAFVDDVSLAHIPTTRCAIAEAAHQRLGAKLTVAVTTVPTCADPATEGDYADAVSYALRQVRACNDDGEIDLRWLVPELVDEAIALTVAEMERTRILNYWIAQSDYTIGPRSESASQIARAIREKYGLVPGANPQGGTIVVRKLRYPS